MATSSLTIPPASSEDLLNSLVNAAYARAKRWTYGVLALQVLLFVGGIGAVFCSGFSLSYPWLAVPLAVLIASMAAIASESRSDAEALKRHLENWSGFGRPISGRKLADFRQKIPKNLTGKADQLLREGNTFASSEKPGAKRAAENLCESAWFSHHQAKWCATVLAVTFVLTFLASITLLFYAAEFFRSPEARVYAAKCVSATVLFVMSGGVWRGWQGFKKFSGRAKDIDEEAARLAATESPDAGEVQRLLGEYQMARAAAPLIPTIVWKILREGLDKDHRNLRTQAN